MYLKGKVYEDSQASGTTLLTRLIWSQGPKQERKATANWEMRKRRGGICAYMGLYAHFWESLPKKLEKKRRYCLKLVMMELTPQQEGLRASANQKKLNVSDADNTHLDEKER